MMRRPSEIMIGDVSLAVILELHAKWRRAEPGGKRADLARADLAGANLAYADLAGVNLTGVNLARADLSGVNLTGAYLARADLYGVRGNMREIKAAQFDKWEVVWTTAADGVVTLQIGCQRHPLEMWRKADPCRIAAMDHDAPEWWARYGAIVLALVDASPATPWGTPQRENANA